MNYIKSLFEGRIGRLHYFFGAIIYSIISGIVYGVLGKAAQSSGIFSVILLLVLVAVSIAYFVFAFGITVRRIHDLNHSGYLAFIILIPIVGWIYSIYLLFAPGTAGLNTYGDVPMDDFVYNVFRTKSQAGPTQTPPPPTPTSPVA